MKITQDMIVVFNLNMENDESILRIEEWNGMENSFQIVACSNVYLDSFILNPNKDFYDTLELFFKERGITLTYNNTKNIFWPAEREFLYV